MESNDHPRPDLKVYRATICFPDALPDLQLGATTRSHFGFKPVLVIGVPSRFYRSFGEASREDTVRLVTRGIDERNVLVLLLQFDGHQLRCVMSLRRPMVQQMLLTMKRRGRFPVVVFDADGHRYAGLDCDVPMADVDAIVAAGLPAVSNSRDCRAELSYVALSCLLVDEMPSIVPEEPLLHVDVALIEDGAFAVTIPMN